MNNVISNFDQILTFAREYGMPDHKKRDIIREFLQAQFIVWLYSLGSAGQLSFVGGTSLRLLRGLDRFSEDLDFDNLGLSKAKILDLMEQVASRFSKQNMKVELVVTDSGDKNYFELRFSDLLNQLGISSNPKEKLRIKVDYAQFWQGQKTEVVLFSRYGLVEQVVTNPLDQLLVQKIQSYVGRNSTQPRDMYDVVWLYAHGARWDEQFEKANGLSDLLALADQKIAQEAISDQMKRRLEPFLFEEQGLRKIEHFKLVITELQKASAGN